MRAAAPVAGRVLEVTVRDGDRVEAGTVLARMDPRDLKPRIEQAAAELGASASATATTRRRSRRSAPCSSSPRPSSPASSASRTPASAPGAFDQAREEVAAYASRSPERRQAIAEHPARLAQLQARLAEARRDAERGKVSVPFAARINGSRLRR